MTISDSDFQRLKEKVEILNGDRRQAADKRAFRYGEIKALHELIASLRGGATELEVRIKVIASDAGGLRVEVEDVQTRVTSAQQAIDTANGRLSQLNQRIAGAQYNIDAVANSVSSAEQKLNAIRAGAGGVTLHEPVSANVGAVPNAEQFNRAVTDIHDLFDALRQLRAVISA